MKYPMQALLGLGGAGLLALTACSSSGGGKTDTGQPGGSAGGTTVAVRSVDNRDVLTDSKGRAVYTSDEEVSAKGRLICTTADCLAIWTPVVVADGQPTAPSSVTAKLGTVTRPDGKKQVTLDGGPLYTFSFDHSAGEVSGDGTKDSFNGTNFTWHVATPSGIAAAPSQAPSSSYNPNGY